MTFGNRLMHGSLWNHHNIPKPDQKKPNSTEPVNTIVEKKNNNIVSNKMPTQKQFREIALKTAVSQSYDRFVDNKGSAFSINGIAMDGSVYAISEYLVVPWAKGMLKNMNEVSPENKDLLLSLASNVVVDWALRMVQGKSNPDFVKSTIRYSVGEFGGALLDKQVFGGNPRE